jgi:hypothetical protein
MKFEKPQKKEKGLNYTKCLYNYNKVTNKYRQLSYLKNEIDKQFNTSIITDNNLFYKHLYEYYDVKQY